MWGEKHSEKEQVFIPVCPFSVSNLILRLTYEALREKVSLLGELDGILSKFHILKIEFLHEKIIFFCLDFFPGKVWLCSVQKWILQ